VEHLTIAGSVNLARIGFIARDGSRFTESVRPTKALGARRGEESAPSNEGTVQRLGFGRERGHVSTGRDAE